MKLYHKLLSVSLTLFLLLSLSACGRSAEVPDQSPAPSEAAAPEPDQSGGPEEVPVEPAVFRAAALKGPTAMGMVRMMAADGMDQFTLAGSADEVTPALIKGDLDVA